MGKATAHPTPIPRVADLLRDPAIRESYRRVRKMSLGAAGVRASNRSSSGTSSTAATSSARAQKSSSFC